jgi:hypothetical protein
LATATASTPSDFNDPDLTVSFVAYLNTSDYVETTVFQNQGGNVTLSAAQMEMIEM